MKPTPENYFQKEIRSKYISNSQIKAFCGTPARSGCQAKAMAELRGEWKTEPSKDMLIGSYVDAHFECSLSKFKLLTPEIFKKDGNLLSEFKHAETIIKVAEADELFMKFMDGEKQVILTGKINELDFIGKVDVLHPHIIVDLKVMKDFERIWCEGFGKLNFIDAWGISEQMAIYQELEYQRTGIKKECYIAALSKEKHPDKAVIYLPQEILDDALLSVKIKSETVKRIKYEGQEPERCEKCDYCKSTKKLNNITSIYDL
ncbi:MAG: PD-(D/E)XK nuclease-like domain-containing protein [Ignavibacteriales bacterium]|nr:PD-(D/E)XK nuclease-like domain-containing protein [Ignavibacteriales bacterium]